METSAVLATFRRDVLAGAPLPPTAIHPDDHMMRYLVDHHNGHRETALFDYFRSGWSAWRGQRALLRWRFGADLSRLRLLDFASGSGRVTRWMIPELRADQIVVSDIFPEAVAFQRELLGVEGVVSAAQPTEVRLGGPFDVILASSFFSHVHPRDFPAWLEALLVAMAPDGMLVFSVHGAELVGAREPTYDPNSEITSLPGERYGTSWVTEEFVGAMLARLRPGASCRRLSKALWSTQDIYVVCLDGRSEELPNLYEPVAFVEGLHREVDALHIHFRGWAYDPSRGAVEIEIRVDGELVARVPAAGVREDVAGYFREAGLARCGWGVRIGFDGAGPLRGEASLSVQAVPTSGRHFPILVGSVEGLELYVRLRNAQLLAERATADAARVGTELASLQGSRLWKVHRTWRDWKRRLGR